MGCNHNNINCGCKDNYLTTPPACPTPVDCPDPQPCSEVFDAQCILYAGNPIVCNNVNVIEAGTNVAQALSNIVAFFCSQDGIDNDIVCGQDTIVTAGTSINDAIDQVVLYFCTAISNVTDALFTDANIEVVNTPDPLEPLCTDSVWTVTFLDAVGGTIDTVQFTTRTCEPRQICNLPLVDPQPFDGLVACRSGEPINIAYQTILDVINANIAARGLFSQIADCTPIQGVFNNGGTLFGGGVGTLSVPPDTFQVGDSYKLDGFGVLTMPSPPSSNELTIEILFNGAVELTMTMDMPQVTIQQWSMEINFAIRSTGAFGQVATAIKFMHEEDANDKLSGHGKTQLAPIDTTVLNTLDVRATWTTANDNRVIISQLMNLHKIY